MIQARQVIAMERTACLRNGPTMKIRSMKLIHQPTGRCHLKYMSTKKRGRTQIVHLRRFRSIRVDTARLVLYTKLMMAKILLLYLIQSCIATEAPDCVSYLVMSTAPRSKLKNEKRDEWWEHKQTEKGEERRKDIWVWKGIWTARIAYAKAQDKTLYTQTVPKPPSTSRQKTISSRWNKTAQVEKEGRSVWNIHACIISAWDQFVRKWSDKFLQVQLECLPRIQTFSEIR